MNWFDVGSSVTKVECGSSSHLQRSDCITSSMETDCFVRSEEKAQRTKRQSLARQSLLKSSHSINKLSRIRNSIIEEYTRSTAFGLEADGIDKLVVTVLKEADDQEGNETDAVDDKTSGEDQPQPDDRKDWQSTSSQFWTYVLAIPVIFTHGVATRMQFQYGGLYGRDGLKLSNAAAILAIGFTALGRATAPPLLLRYFNKPYLFMFLNSTTLLGCAGIFLIPYLGGKNNFDEDGGLKEGQSTGLGTVIFYYFVMFLQGLVEVLSGWDILMKFEMRNWTSGQQQIAFRVSFVSIALGAATAFFSSSWLYESYGLYGCAYLGVAVGVLNVVLPAYYLCCRWGQFASWRDGNESERIKVSRKSQPLMRMLKLDHLDDSTNEFLKKSTRKLKLVQKVDKDQDITHTTITSTSDLDTSSHNGIDKSKHSNNQVGFSYVKPCNYLEYQRQLQHQTSERILKNFHKFYQNQSSRFFKEETDDLSDEAVLAALDPTVLLAHSNHIDWPQKFEKQIRAMKWFCILTLAFGSTMISSQFAVYSLYMVDVWDVSPVFAGSSMAIGEIAGMLTLVFSIFLEKWRAKRSNAEEGASKSKKTMKAVTNQNKKLHLGSPHKKSSEGVGWQALIRSPSLLLQVPSMFVVCCFLSVVPLVFLGFLEPPSSFSKEDEYEELNIMDFSSWPKGLVIIMLSGIAIGIVNCVMHATTIEMSALLLPDDLFGTAVSYGYSLRRIVNLLVCLLATFLYSLSKYMVYQVVAFLYLISVPVSFFVLASFVKCMPWQKREIILKETPGALKNSESSPMTAINTINSETSSMTAISTINSERSSMTAANAINSERSSLTTINTINKEPSLPMIDETGKLALGETSDTQEDYSC